MGKIVSELTKNLIIFRPDEKEKRPDDDYLFYIYDESLNKVTEYISEERLEEMGKMLITIKELDTNAVRKAASMVTPMVRKKGTVTGYEIFGFLLLMRISIDMILSYVYARGFTKLSKEIASSEGSIAYRLGQYFLNELNYAIGFSEDAIDVLSNEQLFKNLYNILVDQLEKADNIKDAYNGFIEAIKEAKL